MWKRGSGTIQPHHPSRTMMRPRRTRNKAIFLLVFLGSLLGLFYSTIQMWNLLGEHTISTDTTQSKSDTSPITSNTTFAEKTERNSSPPPAVFKPPHSFAQRYPAHHHHGWNTIIHKNNNNSVVLDPDDPILIPGLGWDSSPIVIEEFSLLFFTTPKVGTTVFKKLFRRMMGIETWPLEDGNNIPHNPQANGLTYLSDVSYERATEILTSPNWTRALFVRDPLERVLSAYLDKAVRQNGTYVKRHCCGIKNERPMKSSINNLEQQMEQQKQMQQSKQQHLMQLQQQQQLAMQHTQGRRRRRRLQAVNAGMVTNTHTMNRFHSEAALQALRASEVRSKTAMLGGIAKSVLEGAPLPAVCSKNVTMATIITWESFVDDFLSSCSEDPHWKSQVSPSLPWINFVGHFEHLQEDTRRLLERIGAWDQYGAHGWSSVAATDREDGSIFHDNTAQHKTLSRDRMGSYYQDPDLRQKVLQLYRQDYENATLNLTRPAFIINDATNQSI